MSRLQIDSLVRGNAGVTSRKVEGRVYAINRAGFVSIISADGKQHNIYEPEVLADPRPVKARTDIPHRLS